jgi:hypothetical protein
MWPSRKSPRRKRGERPLELLAPGRPERLRETGGRRAARRRACGSARARRPDASAHHFGETGFEPATARWRRSGTPSSATPHTRGARWSRFRGTGSLPRESEIALLSMTRGVPAGVVGVVAAFNAPGWWDSSVAAPAGPISASSRTRHRPDRPADASARGEARGGPALRDQLPRGALGASFPLVACTAREAGKRWASKQTTVSTP